MLPLEILSLFFVSALLLAIAPGPDNIFVLTQSVVHGKASGIFVTLGLCTGLIAHTTAAALGISAVFQTSEFAFTLLKIIGACYLLYLAWRAFRTSDSKIQVEKTDCIGFAKLYRRGIFMNITNPKVSLFFLSFLPQFADPSKGSLQTQLIVLGAVFIVATIIVFGSIAILAGSVGQWINRSSRGRIIINRLSGIIFISLALKLALTER